MAFVEDNSGNTWFVPPEMAATAKAIMEGKPLSLTDAQAAVWNNAKSNRLQGDTFNEATCHQRAFFTVPPPPIGTCWRIEWRWAEEPSDS